MRILRAAAAEIVREIQETYFYRMNLLGDFVVQVLLFGALLMFSGFHSIQGAYHVNRVGARSLVLVGYLFWSYSSWAISAMGSNVASEAARGTLEYKFTSIAPPAVLLAGKAVGGMVTSTVFVAVVVAVIDIAFRVTVSLAAGSFVALFLTLVGMYGVGIAFAGLALVAKRISQVVSVVQILLLFISGTMTPAASLPGLLRWVAMALPVTQGIQVARLSVTQAHLGAFPWLALSATSAVYLIVGLMVFQLLQRKAKANGLLGRY